MFLATDPGQSFGGGFSS